MLSTYLVESLRQDRAAVVAFLSFVRAMARYVGAWFRDMKGKHRRDVARPDATASFWMQVAQTAVAAGLRRGVINGMAITTPRSHACVSCESPCARSLASLILTVVSIGVVSLCSFPRLLPSSSSTYRSRCPRSWGSASR